MKLFVIVLCLLSERFLVHGGAYHRFDWFKAYIRVIETIKITVPVLLSPWGRLLLAILPLSISGVIVFWLFGSVFWGLIGLLMNIIVFYLCLGPGNPFYPTPLLLDPASSLDNEISAGDYLVAANQQLFAVIFWYIFLGPVAVLVYRLVTVYVQETPTNTRATWLLMMLDWVPVRMTALLYLLAGHFQAGLKSFRHAFFYSPSANQALLKETSLAALASEEACSQGLPLAETLVEHAVIILLVLLAFFTLVAWM